MGGGKQVWEVRRRKNNDISQATRRSIDSLVYCDNLPVKIIPSFLNRVRPLWKNKMGKYTESNQKTKPHSLLPKENLIEGIYCTGDGKTEESRVYRPQEVTLLTRLEGRGDIARVQGWFPARSAQQEVKPRSRHSYCWRSCLRQKESRRNMLAFPFLSLPGSWLYFLLA